MYDRENYDGAKVFDSMSYMGENFSITRRRANGKLFRKVFVLLHNGYEMSQSWDGQEVADFKSEMQKSFERTFPEGREDYFRESLKAQYDRSSRGVQLPFRSRP